MYVPAVAGALQKADEGLCQALDHVRRLTDDHTWMACAETDEVEVLRFRISLLELRKLLLGLERQAHNRESVPA